MAQPHFYHQYQMYHVISFEQGHQVQQERLGMLAELYQFYQYLT